ncbi:MULTISPECIES: hypothetical protein [Enterobacteriaceae]|uniref:hypothetical protein n=1 Tax=Enterobacteriaceae TaxID=543 RepID=UPI0013DE9E93|nr:MULTISPECIES: hypothetical protein [Enterobacteriaceae]
MKDPYEQYKQRVSNAWRDSKPVNDAQPVTPVNDPMQQAKQRISEKWRNGK